MKISYDRYLFSKKISNIDVRLSIKYTCQPSKDVMKSRCSVILGKFCTKGSTRYFFSAKLNVYKAKLTITVTLLRMLP